MSISVTIISNVTVLVSNNVICFEYFIPMSHGFNKKILSIVYPPLPPDPSPLPLRGFHQVLLVVLQEIIYQPSFALIRLLQKKKRCIFNVKQFFPFNILLVDFAVFCIFVSWGVFHSSAIIKLQIASYLQSICIASFFASHQIMWRNKRNFGHSLEIISCCFVFLFRGTEETKFEINTTSIILSCLYHFMTANKELCIYCCKMPHYKINKILF